MTDSNDYQAYLIRLQRISGRPHWQVTLENIHDGKLYHFGNEQELLCFLQQHLTLPQMTNNPPELAILSPPYSPNQDPD